MTATSQTYFSHPRLPLALLLLAVLLRIFLIFTGERHTDLDYCYRQWGVHANVHGLASVYEPADHYTAVDYPPLSLYLFYGLDKGNNLLKGLLGDFDAFYFLFKFFLLAVDLALAFLLHSAFRAQGSFPGRFFLTLFNPGLIVVGVLWGQLDNFFTFWVLATVIGLASGRPRAAGAFFGLACATKLQAPLFLPLFAAFFLFRREYGKGLLFLLCAGSAYFLLALPFIIHGSLGRLVSLYAGVPSYYPVLSANAYNLWWIISLGNGSRPDAVPFAAGLSSTMIGLAFFSCAYGTALIGLWKKAGDPGALFTCASFITFAFFMLPTQIHERYLYPFFLLFLLVPEFSRRDLRLYFFTALLFFANITMVFGRSRQYPFFAGDGIYRAVSVAVAAGYLAAFVWAGARFAAVMRTRDPRLSYPGPG